MNYLEAKRYMDDIAGLGSVLGLANMIRLLEYMNNPQDTLKVVHVAGTNGKGSTIAYLESILMSAGYKVGVYTSPVVFDYMEKFRINREYINEEEFAKLVMKLSLTIDKIVGEGFLHPTQFEVETAMAFEYFKSQGCDIVVLETGMGGRLDATNVCDEVLCSVITSISMDHMGFLGDTLDKIAYEKAGIIKEKCPTVLYNGGNFEMGAKEIRETVNAVCQSKNSNLIIADAPKIAEVKKDEIIFDYKELNGLSIKIMGTYQPNNASLAIEAIYQLVNSGYTITEENIREGLSNATWAGRFEKISEQPLIIMDGAHNVGAVTELRKSLDTLYKGYEITYIMGVLKDKNYIEMTDIMFRGKPRVVTVTPHNARGLAGDVLADIIKDKCSEVVYKENYNEAIKQAILWYDQDNVKDNKKLILIFGSLSYLGEMKKVIKGNIF